MLYHRDLQLLFKRTKNYFNPTWVVFFFEMKVLCGTDKFEKTQLKLKANYLKEKLELIIQIKLCTR